MSAELCPDCSHPWSQHVSTANGAHACTHFGCGCKDVVLPAANYVDVAWIDDNNGCGPQKLSNSIRCF